MNLRPAIPRNNAAQGNFGAYTKEQVGMLIQSVRDFITRLPATGYRVWLSP